MLLQAGERVAGRFAVDQLIAEGGLSEVYKVKHIELGAVYALKLLRAEHPTITKRLLMEGRIQAQLTHPNIAPVTDVVRHKGRVGLLMPLIEGKSMAELLDSRKQLPLDESLVLMAGVLSGVGAAHGAGVLHRDIKPGNVLLQHSAGQVRPLVTDFGIAKVAEGMANVTRVGAAMGTPGFSAPEQVLDAADVDVRADVFSLGAMLYRMLTGGMPYVSADGSVRIGSVVSEPYTPLEQAVDNLPAHICAAVDTSLARSAQERFDDLEAMATALLAEEPKLLAQVLAPSGIGPINFELPTLDRELEEAAEVPAQSAGATLMPEMAGAFEPESTPAMPRLDPNQDSTPAPATPTGGGTGLTTLGEGSPVPAVAPAAEAEASPEASRKAPVLWIGAAAAVLLGGLGLWWSQSQGPQVQPSGNLAAAVDPAQPAGSPEALAEALPQPVPEAVPEAVPEPVPEEAQGLASPQENAEGAEASAQGAQSIADPASEPAVPPPEAPEPPPESAEGNSAAQPETAEGQVQPEAAAEAPTEDGPESADAAEVTSSGEAGSDGSPEEDALAQVDPSDAEGSTAEPPAPAPPAEEPEQAPVWSGPDVSGAWSGTAGGRPATMLLKMGPEGQVSGELVFILGATRRSFPVRGKVDEQGRMALSAGDDLQLNAQASGSSINGTYDQGRSKGQSIRLGR